MIRFRLVIFGPIYLKTILCLQFLTLSDYCHLGFYTLALSCILYLLFRYAFNECIEVQFRRPFAGSLLLDNFFYTDNMPVKTV